MRHRVACVAPLLLVLHCWTAHAYSLSRLRSSGNARSCQPQLAEAELQISKAQLSDVKGVVDLTIGVFFGELGDDPGFNNCRATAFAELTAEQESSIRTAILQGYGDGARGAAFKVTAADGRLAGFVASGRGKSGNEPNLLLTNLAVNPADRRQNLGRRLVQQVLEAADGSPVVLEVERDNDAAIALYRACGFQVTGEKEGSRYVVDWWRGRVFAETSLVVMRHDGASEPASTASTGDTCDAADPTGLCVSEDSEM